MYGIFKINKKNNKNLQKECLLQFPNLQTARAIYKNLEIDYNEKRNNKEIIFEDLFKLQKV